MYRVSAEETDYLAGFQIISIRGSFLIYILSSVLTIFLFWYFIYRNLW